MSSKNSTKETAPKIGNELKKILWQTFAKTPNNVENPCPFCGETVHILKMNFKFYKEHDSEDVNSIFCCSKCLHIELSQLFDKSDNEKFDHIKNVFEKEVFYKTSKDKSPSSEKPKVVTVTLGKKSKNEKIVCEGTTKKGEPCKKYAINESKFCDKHQV